ncbi:MAG: arsenate reductase (glutaredoxin) [Fluviicola sp.]|nr:MAG: arsenate reductase (glutaredoxin) [Fluviicola sp.]
MLIYHNPRCSKSRQTLQLLEENGVSPEVVLYLEDVPSKSDLKNILKKLEISAEKLIRKGEKDYKENFKGKSLSEDEWIDAMIKFPKLIERPIFVKGNKAVIGRPPENILDIL